MKKLVPFQKDITFDTNVAEINSISLEHEITTKEESLISGKFIVSGDYKMTNASIHLDTFEYELPFNITIDKKYFVEDAEIDISDFYYEIVNNRILSVNIELSVDNIEEKKEEENMAREELTSELEEIPVVEEEIEHNIEPVSKEEKTKEPPITEVSKEEMPKETEEEKEEKNETRETTVKSLFDNLDENETYVVYKIHIVTENDTIESIINDYGITRDNLSLYNDLSDVKVGDKIIIPNEN